MARVWRLKQRFGFAGRGISPGPILPLTGSRSACSTSALVGARIGRPFVTLMPPQTAAVVCVIGARAAPARWWWWVPRRRPRSFAAVEQDRGRAEASAGCRWRCVNRPTKPIWGQSWRDHDRFVFAVAPPPARAHRFAAAAGQRGAHGPVEQVPPERVLAVSYGDRPCTTSTRRACRQRQKVVWRAAPRCWTTRLKVLLAPGLFQRRASINWFERVADQWWV